MILILLFFAKNNNKGISLINELVFSNSYINKVIINN